MTATSEVQKMSSKEIRRSISQHDVKGSSKRFRFHRQPCDPGRIKFNNVPESEPFLASWRHHCRPVITLKGRDGNSCLNRTGLSGPHEEVSGPKLEKLSGLKVNKDFFFGYSPRKRRQPRGTKDKRSSKKSKKNSVAGSYARHAGVGLWACIQKVGSPPAFNKAA